jgi:hypothetical protein
MMEVIKKVRRASKSKTIVWGHIQIAAGAVATGLAFVNPATFANLPTWAYGMAAMSAGMITYVLRSVTRKPLDEK